MGFKVASDVVMIFLNVEFLGYYNFLFETALIILNEKSLITVLYSSRRHAKSYTTRVH